jgi:phosphatidylglycerophosphatase C
MPEPASRLVAAFDFDGTLTNRDQLVEFLVRVAPLRTAWAFARELRLALGLIRGTVSRDEFKTAIFARALAGLDATKVDTRARHFAELVLRKRLRPEMRERVAWHRAQGHELVMVSASLAAYLEPIGEELGFEKVIAVNLEVGTDGRLTGVMVGGNVRGEAKASLLRTWLGSLTGVELWAYGDSDGDRELLAMADHPTRI